MENVRNEGTDKTNEEASLTKIMDGANEKNETIREGIVFVDEKSCNNTESDNKSKMLLLHQLANRLKKCEMYVGSYEEFYENSLLCETSFTNKEGESEMDTLKTNSEKQQKEEELREKLRAILNYRNSMATQIKLLYQLIEQLFDGKISILNEKCL
jgi:aspartokinase